VKTIQRSTSTGPKAGFTLAEILVTILIMGGIMVSVTQILHAARTSRDTIHNIQETQLAGPAIMDMIERDLRAILVYNRTRADHIKVQDRIMLGVDGDSIDFVTTTDSLVARYDGERVLHSPINEVGYRLRPNPAYDGFLEIYRREDAGIDDIPFEGGEFSFLHDRVKTFDIQVFNEDGTDAEPFADWGVNAEDEERIGLPTRLEITLKLELQRRIGREALMRAPTYLTEVTYKRVIRLPEALRVEEEDLIVPLIPTPSDSADPDAGGGGGGEGDPLGTSGGGGGRGGGRGESGDAGSGGRDPLTVTGGGKSE